MRRRIIYGILLGLLISSSASAQFYFEETFIPVYKKINDAASPADGGHNVDAPVATGIGTDFRTTIGYVQNNLFIYGLSYNTYNLTTTRDVTSIYESENNNTKRSELGPAVGVMLGSWRILFTYFFQATKEASEKLVDSTSTVVLDHTDTSTAGSGFQFAISYGLSLGSGFEIGPSLVYRSMTYKKQSKTDRVTAGNSYPESDLQSAGVEADLNPMVTVSYNY